MCVCVCVCVCVCFQVFKNAVIGHWYATILLYLINCWNIELILKHSMYPNSSRIYINICWLFCFKFVSNLFLHEEVRLFDIRTNAS